MIHDLFAKQRKRRVYPVPDWGVVVPELSRVRRRAIQSLGRVYSGALGIRIRGERTELRQ